MIKKVLILLCVFFILSGCSLSIVNKNHNYSTDKQEQRVNEDIDPMEKEFNESGRAKAIEKEEDLWQFYENIFSLFSLKYPHSVSLNGKNEDLSLQLIITSKKIETLEDTEYGQDVDWPFGASKKIRKIKNKNAQEFMVLNRFEVCDVNFGRKLYFFNNNYQVVITLKIDPKIIKNSMPNYFTTNKEDCGEELVWDLEKQEDFYNTLKSGQGSPEAQNWFNTFDRIIETIEFIETTNKNNLEQIQGIWTSIDDTKYIVAFLNDKRIEFYDNKKTSENILEIYNHYPITTESVQDKNGKYLRVVDGEDVFEYKIDSISESELTLIYLPQGNMLKFKK